MTIWSFFFAYYMHGNLIFSFSLMVRLSPEGDFGLGFRLLSGEDASVFSPNLTDQEPSTPL